MRWDFFRYLLDIQGLTVAGSKDGGGREISGHKDKDKSQPQLLSSRNLHHHHHHHQQQQLIVSISSPASSNNGHHHHHDGVVGDKKSPHSHSTLPSSEKSISLSSSLPTKTGTTATNPCNTNSPSLTNDNDNDTIAILDDETINHPVQEKKAILLSPSPWHNKNYTVINYKGNKGVANQSSPPPPSNLISKDNDKNCNTLPSQNYDCLQTVTVNINYYKNVEKSREPLGGNNLPPTGAICLSDVNNPGPSPKIYGTATPSHLKSNGHHYQYQPGKSGLSHHNQFRDQHDYSLSTSTGSNMAEANGNGVLAPGGVEEGQGNEPATEDEASSIASSDLSSDFVSNSAKNHQAPTALAPAVVPTTYSSLRWTRAVANQEWSNSFPRAQQILRPIVLVGGDRGSGCDYDVESYRTHSPPGKKKDGGEEAKRNDNMTVAAAAPLVSKNRAVVITSTTSTNANASAIRKIGSGGNEPRLLLQAHRQQERPTSSIIGGNAVATTSASGSVGSCGVNNTLFVYQDKWRVLFDKFDREGFGEITWTDFLLALRSKEFQLAIEPGKLQLLEDLARVHSAQTNAITFQLFVNIMTGKRSRSFKCAVHQRDREVCSESDFHLLPLGYQSPTGVKRMARLIADEFLTDERDRKYYADHYRCIPPPLFIISITLIELGFFTYYTVWHGEISSSGPLPMDSPFVYRPDKRQEVWRFLFYMVLHAGWVHLMFNLLVQLLVGLPLEMVHGSLRIGCVYMAGVLAGSLGTSVFDPDVYLVGASGGVYALLAAHLANVLLNYNNMEFGLVRLLGVFLIASVDVGFAIYDRYAASEGSLTEGSVPPVSYVAHLTGALAGLTIGLLVLKNFEQKLREQLMWWLALGVYAACTLFAILFNIFHPVYPEMITSEFVEIPEKFPHHQIQ